MTVPGSVAFAVAVGSVMSDSEVVVLVLDITALVTAVSAAAGAVYGLFRLTRRIARNFRRWLFAEITERIEAHEARMHHAVRQVDAVMSRVGTRDGDIVTRPSSDKKET